MGTAQPEFPSLLPLGSCHCNEILHRDLRMWRFHPTATLHPKEGGRERPPGLGGDVLTQQS